MKASQVVPLSPPCDSLFALMEWIVEGAGTGEGVITRFDIGFKIVVAVVDLTTGWFDDNGIVVGYSRAGGGPRLECGESTKCSGVTLSCCRTENTITSRIVANSMNERARGGIIL